MISGELVRAFGRTDSDGFTAEQRRVIRRAVYERRLMNWRYVQIAEDLGISPAYARQAFETYRKEIPDTDREMHRALEEDRLDVMERSIWERYIETKDPKLVELLLRVSERRSRLLGLDAPVKTEARVSVDEGPDVDLDALLREAQATAG